MTQQYPKIPNPTEVWVDEYKRLKSHTTEQIDSMIYSQIKLFSWFYKLI